MKEVGGIKSLSIGAIAMNSGLFGMLLLALLALMGLAPMKEEGIILLIILIFVLMGAIAYPLQLLLVRRKYYRHIPISSRTRLFTHISRIVQLLYSLLLVWALIISVYNIYKYKATAFRNNYALVLQIGLYLLILASAILNLILFFKGWRFLKQTRKSYIDKVMATFDDADLSKQ